MDATIRALGKVDALEPHRSAILAAMVITDELFRSREELRSLREEIERRSALLADRIQRVSGIEVPEEDDASA